MPEITVQDLIRREAEAARIPVPVALGLAEYESGFNPGAIGDPLPTGQRAVGVYQFLPGTAARYGVTDPSDPRQNIPGAMRYLKDLFQKHNGNEDAILAEFGGVTNNTTYVPGARARITKYLQAASDVATPPAKPPTGPVSPNAQAEIPMPELPPLVPPGAATSIGPRPRTAGDAVADFTKEALVGLNPAVWNQALQAAFWHPIETGKGLLEAQAVPGQQALDAYRQGDYGRAAIKGLYWLLPGIGPRLSQAGDLLEQGEIARGLGASTDVGLQVAGPTLLNKLRLPERFINRTPLEQRAIRWGQTAGDVPIDAASATGNRWIRQVQKIAGSTPIGAGIDWWARYRQGQAMTAAGERLADYAHPTRTTAEAAGAGSRNRLQGLAQQLGATADTAYDELRQLEQQHVQTVSSTRQPAPAPVGRGPQGSAPPPPPVTTTRQVAMPVDVRARKAALRPIYDQILQEWPITRQERSPALRALQNFLDGPDIESASVLDRNIGRIKSITRDTTLPAATRRLAHQVIDELDNELQATARSFDPRAEQALLRGRAATRAKYDALDLLDELHEEPVQAFNQLLIAGDKGIERLRNLHQQVPQAFPELGRAWLDNALGTATATGGYTREATLFNNWRALGPETKRLLYPAPGHVDALDNFFLLGKILSENPNPSGSALTAAAGTTAGAWYFNPVFAMWSMGGGAALSTLLNSPAGTRLLIEGMRLPLGSGAAVAWVEQVNRAVEEEKQRDANSQRFAAPRSIDEVKQRFGNVMVSHPPPKPPGSAQAR